jgi:hypothetical protein
MLGGLVGGPFGALWGASIEANVGAKCTQEAAQNAEMKQMGITPVWRKMLPTCTWSPHCLYLRYKMNAIYEQNLSITI